MQRKETKARSITKAISWRVVGTLINMIVIYGLFKDPILSITVGGVDIVVKTFMYFLHERAWSSIKWGYDDGE